MNSVELLIPVLAMLALAMLVAGGALFVGRFLGPSHLVGVKVATYECGIAPTGTSRDRVSVKYYLVAILFLLFDLEAAFLLPVALAWDELSALGVVVLCSMAFFMFFFILGLWYE